MIDRPPLGAAPSQREYNYVTVEKTTQGGEILKLYRGFRKDREGGA